MPAKVTQERLVSLPILGVLFTISIASFAVAPWIAFFYSATLMHGFFQLPSAILVVHLYTLGVGLAAALGAMQQLIPVVYHTPPVDRATASESAIAYGLGYLVILVGFSRFEAVWIASGGTLVLLGAAAAMINTARVYRQRTNLEAVMGPYMLMAGINLLVLLVLGVMMALGIGTGWAWAFSRKILTLHVSLGLAAWFSTLVFGVSHWLIPFFGLSVNKTRGRYPWVVLGGLIMTTAAVYSGGFWTAWAKVAAGIYLATVGVYVWDTRHLFFPQKRRTVNALITFIRFGHIHLVLLAILLVTMTAGWLPAQRWTIPVGMIALMGWLSGNVIGYLHRILPFVTWHNKYWGKKGVPLLSEFVNHRLARGAAWVYNFGLIVAVVGVGLQATFAVQAGLIVQGAAAAAIAVHLILVLGK